MRLKFEVVGLRCIIISHITGVLIKYIHNVNCTLLHLFFLPYLILRRLALIFQFFYVRRIVQFNTLMLFQVMARTKQRDPNLVFLTYVLARNQIAQSAR